MALIRSRLRVMGGRAGLRLPPPDLPDVYETSGPRLRSMDYRWSPGLFSVVATAAVLVALGFGIAYVVLMLAAAQV